MSNPYNYGDLGERFPGAGEPIPKSLLDRPMIKADHLKWALENAGIGTDGQETLTWEAPKIWKTGDGEFDLFAAIWLDATNECIRVKLAIGEVPEPEDEQDGQRVQLTTDTPPEELPDF